MTTPVHVVVISEQARERRELTRALNSMPGIEIVAEVDLVCQMGQQACLCGAPVCVRARTGRRRQAGDIEADCVVLDIDRYPLAGTLGLAQARGTFPGANIILLVRSIHPRYLQFLKESGASCCIDKDDPDTLTQLTSALHVIAESVAGHRAFVSRFQRPRLTSGRESPRSDSSGEGWESYIANSASDL